MGGLGTGIQIWDLVRMECMEELSIQNADVFELSLSRGGTKLVAALGNNEIAVFRLLWELQVPTKSFEIPRRLSPWSNFFKRFKGKVT